MGWTPQSSNGNGLSINSIIQTVLAAAIGALLSWVVRLDDRVFTLHANAATKTEVRTLEYRIDAKLDSILEKVDKLQSDIDRNLLRRSNGRAQMDSNR